MVWQWRRARMMQPRWGRKLFGTVTQGSPALRANPGLSDGIPLGYGPKAAAPKPTTMIAGALLLLSFGASTLRMLRKSRAA